MTTSEFEWPPIVRRSDERSLRDLLVESAWRERLTADGALLFRGFQVLELPTFAAVVRTVIGNAVPYEYRSTPRLKLDADVYTATEHHEDVTIVPHHEMSYQRDWPMKLVLACLEAPESGGEAILGRTAGVTARIDPSVRDRFRRLGVRYVVNYREGLGRSWQDVFATSDTAVVEAFSRSHDMSIEWLEHGALRTTHVAQGLAVHPLTGDECWFNQAHSYHASILDGRTRAALVARYGEAGLPRHTYYGDGSPIPDEVIAAVRQAFAEETRLIAYEPGDVLIVDNMQAFHGRMPYRGTRRVVVGMGDPYTVVASAAQPA